MLCGACQRLALPAGGRAWIQIGSRKKLKARKRLEKRADSHLSGARIVRRTHGTPTFLMDNELQTHLENILPTIKTLAITKKDHDEPEVLPSKFPIKGKINFAEEQTLT